MAPTQKRFVRLASTAMIAIGLSPFSDRAAIADEPPAEGDLEKKKACVDHHEQAQLLKRSSKFVEARSALVACAQDTCPAVVRTDCVQWLGDLTAATPSVVFHVKVAGVDASAVRVYADATLIATRLDGLAVELNPGLHTFRFESPAQEPVELPLLLVEGEKNRIVDVALGHAEAPAPAFAPAPPLPPTYRPIPVLDFVFGGVAAAGVGAFAGFGIWGLNEKGSLENNCEPVCTKSDVDSVRTKFIVADVSLAAAIVSAAAAGYVYFTRPTVELPLARGTAHQARSAGPLRLGWSAGPSGASLDLEAPF